MSNFISKFWLTLLVEEIVSPDLLYYELRLLLHKWPESPNVTNEVYMISLTCCQ